MRNLPFLAAPVLLTILGAAQTTAPDITRVTVTPTGASVVWTPTTPDQSYTLQANTRLKGGLWTLAPLDRPWPIDATEVSITPEPGTDQLFLRLLAVTPADRGRVLSVTSLGTLQTWQIALLFNFAGIEITPEYGVQSLRIRYETIDPWGERTVASGVLTLPQGLTQPLPLVSYQHGTVTETNDVPSYNQYQRLPGIGLATAGYATTLPDYLGLGDSSGFHPYHHARSEATAAIDLLRAAKIWCSTNHVTLSDRLFLCGYSQGGHATLALHRELQIYYPDEFTVTASAPMAGAYDLSVTTLNDLLSGRPLPNPYYVAYLLAAYQDVYRITNSWGDWLTAPYDTTLPPLLADRASGSTINTAMQTNPPDDVRLIFKPEVLAALQNDPSHPIRQALRENDLTHWRPEAPIRMFHCSNDLDVPPANSTVALASFQAQGAREIELVDPSPGSDHGGCVIPSFLDAKVWFDTFGP